MKSIPQTLDRRLLSLDGMRRLRHLATASLAAFALTACADPDIVGVEYDHYYGDDGAIGGETDGGELEPGDAGGDDDGSLGGDEGGEDGFGLEPLPVAYCGDGHVDHDRGEECDDAEANGDASACTASCEINVCGDGLVYAGVEQCDLGAGNDPNGVCTDECTINQ